MSAATQRAAGTRPKRLSTGARARTKPDLKAVAPPGSSPMRPLIADPVRLLVMMRLNTLNLSLNEASRRIGRNPTYLYKFVQLGIPGQLPDETCKELARLLKVKPEELQQQRAECVENTARYSRMRADVIYQGGIDGPRDLPLLSVTSLYAAMIKPQAEYTERPPYLGGVRGAFGVRMPDNSLLLRYKMGDTLFFHPGVVPAPGDGVFVELENGDRVLGILDQLGPDGIAIRRDTANDVLDSYTAEDIKRLAAEVGTKRVGNL